MIGEGEQARIGLARTLARTLLKDAGIKEPPTSLRAVIAHLQKKHDLQVHANSTLREGVSGLLVTVESEHLDDERGQRYDEIHYNESHSWHRKRFTIAHEIGHMMLNTSCGDSFLVFDFVKDPIEVGANQFAAELLIPLASIKKDLRSPKAKVPDLAWKYIVSQEAMGWKISSCSLLGRL